MAARPRGAEGVEMQGRLAVGLISPARAAGEEIDVSSEGKLFMGLTVVMQLVIALILSAAGVEVHLTDDLRGKYGYFRDVNIMIFFGFGMLMTFLRRYGYSAIGYCMIVSALCVQFSCAFRIIFDPENPHVKLENCMEGLFCAGAVMISYGAVLGKTTPSMLMVMGILETMAFWVNNWIVFDVLGAHDVGGGMVIHTFGAYFGLAATFVLYDVGSDEHKDEATCYSSDLFSLTGTLLLWLLWPSFNAAVAGSPEAENLAIVNTLICGCGCILGFGVASRALSGWKFDTVHLQNATLAGGVMMGVIGDKPIGLHTAGVAGFFAACLSSWGYAVLTPLLASKLKIHDTCGVNNLHGMPGIAGSILAAVVVTVLDDGDARTQIIALAVSFGIAVAAGLVTGFIMKLTAACTIGVPGLQFFNDRMFWVVPSDYEVVAK
jgi:ammonium transporter Rh